MASLFKDWGIWSNWDWIVDWLVDIYQIIERGNPALAVRQYQGRQLVWRDNLRIVPLGEKILNYKTATVFEYAENRTDSRTVCIMWFTDSVGCELDKKRESFIEQCLDTELPDVDLVYPPDSLRDFSNKKRDFLKHTLSSMFSPDLKPVKLSPLQLSQVFPELEFISLYDKIVISNNDTFEQITFNGGISVSSSIMDTTKNNFNADN